jgi:hypothetical protein
VACEDDLAVRLDCDSLCDGCDVAKVDEPPSVDGEAAIGASIDVLASNSKLSADIFEEAACHDGLAVRLSGDGLTGDAATEVGDHRATVTKGRIEVPRSRERACFAKGPDSEHERGCQR